MSVGNLSDKNFASGVATPVAKTRKYKDINLRSGIHPTTGDIVKLTDIEAIKRSVSNIILTRKGESLFFPQRGTEIDDYLFEFADDITKSLFGQELKRQIELFEPRVKVYSIAIDMKPNNNEMVATVKMTVVDLQQIIDLSVVIERLR